MRDQPKPVLSVEILHFTQASDPERFAQAMGLRMAVFVEEQNVPAEEESDDADETALHWLIVDAVTNETLAVGRSFSYQEGCQMAPVAKIGRFAVAAGGRGKGIGERLLNAMITQARTEGFMAALLDSQIQAAPFYAKSGFVGEGEPFDDAGIPHIRMRLVF